MKKSLLKKILDQRVTIFFIVLASLLWFFNRLNRKFTTEIPLNIEIVEDYNSKVWLQENVIPYNINGETDGRIILIAKLGVMPNIKVNASSLKFIAKDKYINVIEPNSLKHAIQQKFNNLTINYIIDSLNKVIVSPLIEKKLPVKHNISISCAKQFMIIDSIKLSFDSVNIKAPQIILDTMRCIATEKYEKKQANSTIQSTLDLIVNKNIIVEKKEVGFIAEIAGFTEINIDLPIGLKNNNSDKNITLIPNKTSVKAHIPLEKYDANNKVHAYIDLAKKRNSSLYEVSIDSLPKGAKIISIDPQFIEAFYN